MSPFFTASINSILLNTLPERTNLTHKSVSKGRIRKKWFIRAYNEKTAKMKGQVIPAVITVYTDRTFSFITKLPPVAEMIKKQLKIEKGSGKAGRESAGTLTKAQVEAIAKEKLGDLNTDSVEQAKKVVVGTARSMGIKVE